MVDPDDICEDLSDTLPSTVTAFTALFVDDDALQVSAVVAHSLADLMVVGLNPVHEM